MEQLFEGVYVLRGDIRGRPLQVVYLRGQSASVLLDTGCSGDPGRFIIPQVRQSGGDPSQLTWIINSHPDVDHIGGNAEMRRSAPGAVLACGEADRACCGDTEELMLRRYRAYESDHGMGYDAAGLAWLRSAAGDLPPVDAGLTGGERLHLGGGWVVEILALPGHAKGHLGIFDVKNAALYAADAIHGRLYPGLDGTAALCPTYVDVEDTLSTIRLIEHLPLTTYVGCHWPVKREGAIHDFCAESRAFVTQCDRLLLTHLVRPMTLEELCIELGPKLGDWPRDLDRRLMFVLCGHLERLVALRRIRCRERGQAGIRLLEYQLA